MKNLLVVGVAKILFGFIVGKKMEIFIISKRKNFFYIGQPQFTIHFKFIFRCYVNINFFALA